MVYFCAVTEVLTLGHSEILWFLIWVGSNNAIIKEKAVYFAGTS
jgi:hypothetical protein